MNRSKAIWAISAVLVTTVALAGSAQATEQGATSENTPASAFGSLSASWSDPGAQTGDEFGIATSISGDTAIVGALYAGPNQFGRAYIYTEAASGWPSDPSVELDAPPADTNLDDFGLSVAVAGDTAVVGAPGNDENDGAAYVYTKGPSGWPTTPSYTLVDPSPYPGIYFGWSVAASGNTIIVGDLAGLAYIYTKEPSGWPTTPPVALSSQGNFFGSSVAVSGSSAVVGGREDTAYVYDESASGWPTSPTATLVDPGGDAADSFGYTVAVSGNTVAVGAYQASGGDGAAYAYTKSSSGWPADPSATMLDPNGTSGDGFGYSVAASPGTVVVGSLPESDLSGSAYVYLEHSSMWQTTPSALVSDPAPLPSGDYFGSSVAVSGPTALVGAPHLNTFAGETYAFSVLPKNPLNTVLPQVSGSLSSGEAVVKDPGKWIGPKPLTYRFQWERCSGPSSSSGCAQIPGATNGHQYVLRSSDVGKYLTIKVTATDSSGGHGTAVAVPVGPVVKANLRS